MKKKGLVIGGVALALVAAVIACIFIFTGGKEWWAPEARRLMLTPWITGWT